jgi:hypothetical protein
MSYHLLDNVTLSGASSYTYSDFNETSSSTVGTYWAWEFRFHDMTNPSFYNYYPQLQATASLNIPYTITYNAFTSTSPYTSHNTGSSWITLAGLSTYNVPSNGKLLIEQPKRNGTTWFSNFEFDWTTYDSTYGYARYNSFGVFTDYTSIDEITIQPHNGTLSGGISVYGIVS